MYERQRGGDRNGFHKVLSFDSSRPIRLSYVAMSCIKRIDIQDLDETENGTERTEPIFGIRKFFF